MNRSTFQDAVEDKKKSILEDLDIVEEEDKVGKLEGTIEGEEEEEEIIDYNDRVNLIL